MMFSMNDLIQLCCKIMSCVWEGEGTDLHSGGLEVLWLHCEPSVGGEMSERVGGMEGGKGGWREGGREGLEH